MLSTTANLDHFDRIDAEIQSVAKSIRILDSLTWPREEEARFLAGWRAGTPALPTVELSAPDQQNQIAALESIMARCDRAHPMGDHLFNQLDASQVLQIGLALLHRHRIRIKLEPILGIELDHDVGRWSTTHRVEHVFLKHVVGAVV